MCRNAPEPSTPTRAQAARTVDGGPSYSPRVRLPPATSIVALVMAVAALCGCSDSHTATQSTTVQKTGLRFVAAPRALLTKCRATARAVGYSVPCPTYIPAGLAMDPSHAGCLDIIGPGGLAACGAGTAWRGWVVGTSNVGAEHLVITASPRRLANYAKVVNGPAWYPTAKVRPLRRVNINGWDMSAVYVPPATNDGSAFAHHVVLVWSDAGHTYGIGFHNTQGIHRTLLIDEELARHIKLVGP